MEESHFAPEQGRRRRVRIVWLSLALVVGLVALLTVLAWQWALPRYVESRLTETFSQLTEREVTIESVSFDALDLDPLGVQVRLNEARIPGEGDGSTFTSEVIVAEVRLASLWSSLWHIDRLRLASPRLHMIQDAEGELNLAQLFGGDEASEGDATSVRIDRIDIEDGRLDWTNRRLEPPVTLTLNALQAGAHGYDSRSDEPFTLQGEADWNGGTLSGEGEMGFSPWTVDVELAPRDLPLATLSDYIDTLMRARTHAGQLAADLRVRAGAAGEGATRVSGQGTLTGLDMLAPEVDRSLATAERIDIEGFDFESGQPRLDIERVGLKSAWMDVRIEEDLSTNLTAWLPPQDASQDEQTQDENPLQYRIGTLAIEQGAVAFSDHHLPQPFEIDFSALQGEWRQLSSAQEGDGQLALAGEVSEGSPMRIEGMFDPLGDRLQGNLRLEFERLAMTHFAPYVREFAGYTVEQGEATLSLDYRLEQGQLNADNHLVLRQVELGEEVDASVTDLPLRTLVGVLKSNDGIIELDIPMQLPLDDPSEVDFGSIIGQAIRQALESLVSSPLETLSEVVEGEGESGSDDGNDAQSSASAEAESNDETGLYERAGTRQ